MENSHSDDSGQMLTGVFADRASTEKAYSALSERGYAKDDTNLVMSDETRNKYYSDENDPSELGSKAAESAGRGSAIGGTIGAIVGVIAAISVM